MAARTKEEFIEKCCGGFSRIELNIVENTWRAAVGFMEEKFTSTNTGNPKLPTVEATIESIRNDTESWNKAVQCDPLWIAMIKLCHEFIGRQLRASA